MSLEGVKKSQTPFCGHRVVNDQSVVLAAFEVAPGIPRTPLLWRYLDGRKSRVDGPLSPILAMEAPELAMTLVVIKPGQSTF